MHTLFTTGYAGFDADGFLWKLRLDGIECVIDVRNSTFSRNPAFSQNVLQRFLERHGIEYVHLQQLGVPSTLRKKLRSGGNLADYFDFYKEHLSGEEAVINAITPRLLEKNCCLLCLEKNAAECHRSVLADWIVEKNKDILEVKHI